MSLKGNYLVGAILVAPRRGTALGQTIAIEFAADARTEPSPKSIAANAGESSSASILPLPAEEFASPPRPRASTISLPMRTAPGVYAADSVVRADQSRSEVARAVRDCPPITSTRERTDPVSSTPSGAAIALSSGPRLASFAAYAADKSKLWARIVLVNSVRRRSWARAVSDGVAARSLSRVTMPIL